VMRYFREFYTSTSEHSIVPAVVFLCGSRNFYNQARIYSQELSWLGHESFVFGYSDTAGTNEPVVTGPEDIKEVIAYTDYMCFMSPKGNDISLICEGSAGIYAGLVAARNNGYVKKIIMVSPEFGSEAALEISGRLHTMAEISTAEKSKIIREISKYQGDVLILSDEASRDNEHFRELQELMGSNRCMLRTLPPADSEFESEYHNSNLRLIEYFLAGLTGVGEFKLTGGKTSLTVQDSYGTVIFSGQLKPRSKQSDISTYKGKDKDGHTTEFTIQDINEGRYEHSINIQTSLPELKACDHRVLRLVSWPCSNGQNISMMAQPSDRWHNYGHFSIVDHYPASRTTKHIYIPGFTERGGSISVTGDVFPSDYKYYSPMDDDHPVTHYKNDCYKTICFGEKVRFTGSVSEMFLWCTSLKHIDMHNVNTSEVTDMSKMFMHCGTIQVLDVSSFSFDKVTDMSHMFEECRNLREIFWPASMNTSGVTDMSHMFDSCTKIEHLDLSSFDTSSVENFDDMFCLCGRLRTLNISSFDLTAVTDERNLDMFTYCHSLETIITPRRVGTPDVLLPCLMYDWDDNNREYETFPKDGSHVLHRIKRTRW